ncbi:PLP-dependent transferase [Stipitochalara longipes BDJ]|nr:PLP-dependent transferase [Stipitochalara longipes BDJ]
MALKLLDVEKVRARFPALSRDQEFFDNAGGSQTLGTVIQSVQDYLINSNVQHGGSYATCQEATSRYSKAYAAIARYINASRDDIVLGSSTTQNFRNLSYTFHFNEGDEVLISAIDHEANIAPWVDLAKRQKLILKWWIPTSGSANSPKLLPEDLERLLTKKTRLVTCTHTSNVLGSIHDIQAISDKIREINSRTLICVDGVAYAAHRQIDVKKLGVDFYSISWYKVYGPHIALLYASSKGQEQMHSLGHYFLPHRTLEDKLRLAGSCFELVHAVRAVTDYLDFDEDVGLWAGIVWQEARLQRTLLKYLNSRDDVTIWGETSPDPQLRVPTISFTVKGWNSKELVAAIQRDTNLGLKCGKFYSYRLVRQILQLGDDGVVRVSMVHYNTLHEVNHLISVLDQVLSIKPA